MKLLLAIAVMNLICYISCSVNKEINKAKEETNPNDRIYNAQLDLSKTYHDVYDHFIIYNGHAYLKGDWIDKKTLEHEILAMHQKMLERENARLNPK